MWESKEWYRMKEPTFNSGFEDCEFYAYGADGFIEVLNSFLGSQVKIYDRRLSANPENHRVIIQNVTSDSESGSIIRQILTNVGVLKCGQYIETTTPSENSAYWMVATMPDNNRIYEKAVLWKCRYTLHFRSPLSGEIVDYPIYVENATQYGTGENDREHIAIGDASYLIYIPHNAETIMLDDRFRFLMDRNQRHPTAYRITQVDSVSRAVGDETDGGIIRWSVVETPYNEATDNSELMVADYYPNRSESITDAISIIDPDKNELVIVGETKELFVLALSTDGPPMPTNSFNYIVLDGEDVCESTARDGNKISIRTKNLKETVGRTITVRVVSGSASADIVLTVANW